MENEEWIRDRVTYLAGLEQRSRGELLGLLLAAASTTEDPQRWASWKVRGDALLAEKEQT